MEGQPMRARTRAGLVTRLGDLECRVAASDQPIKLRFGHLKQLLREYQGEDHVIVARELPKQGDQEWVEFEEVPGPDPDPPERCARPAVRSALVTRTVSTPATLLA